MSRSYHPDHLEEPMPESLIPNDREPDSAPEGKAEQAERGRLLKGISNGSFQPSTRPEVLAGPARRALGVSDYERLVELAAKGMAERDNHPMPESVRTPEAFYEVMARAALDAVDLQALLEELARAEHESKNAHEGPILPMNAAAATTPIEQPSATTSRHGYENGVLDTRKRRERAASKASDAHLRCEWTSAAEERLTVVTTAVERLQKALNFASEMPSEASGNSASEVVTGCDRLTWWLSSTRAPRGLKKAEAQLGAAAGVYRNAAIVYRHINDVEGHQRWARSNACAKLLEQGDHHVEAFGAALAKRLDDHVAGERRSSGESNTPGGALL